MTPKQGKQGTNTSTVITTPARLKRSRTAREREEDRWAAGSGPVTVTRIPAGNLPPVDAAIRRQALDELNRQLETDASAEQLLAELREELES